MKIYRYKTKKNSSLIVSGCKTIILIAYGRFAVYMIVTFKREIHIKQYIKNKLKKWGIKIYVLTRQRGLIYDSIIYEGVTSEIKPGYILCSAAAAILMQLSERIADPNIAYSLILFSIYQLFQFAEVRQR